MNIDNRNNAYLRILAERSKLNIDNSFFNSDNGKDLFTESIEYISSNSAKWSNEDLDYLRSILKKYIIPYYIVEINDDKQ